MAKKQNGEQKIMDEKSQVATPNNNESSSNSRSGVNMNPAEGIIHIRNILLGDLVQRWEVKINRMESGVRELIRKTESRLAAMEEKIERLDKELKEELETNLMEIEQENEELRTLVENFKQEFEEKIKELDSGKLDKDSIAEVFMQWAQQFKKGG
ncbi:MAG: hypothetical protein Q9P14_10905 [candidate division KSB1 bacterium]|nr:hypothetical protein [candidate division KSB1 bacterium]MDQ7063237.1 hypothetical protein [candidate division KSB1 bacterium]